MKYIYIQSACTTNTVSMPAANHYGAVADIVAGKLEPVWQLTPIWCLICLHMTSKWLLGCHNSTVTLRNSWSCRYIIIICNVAWQKIMRCRLSSQSVRGQGHQVKCVCTVNNNTVKYTSRDLSFCKWHCNMIRHNTVPSRFLLSIYPFTITCRLHLNTPDACPSLSRRSTSQKKLAW